jgi:hypothetical protein
VITHLQDSPENPDFWDVLGGFRAPETLPMGEVDVDILADKKTKLKMKSKLLKMSDDNTLEDMNEDILKREMLENNNVFLLHCFDKLFLWVGNTAKVCIYIYTYVYIRKYIYIYICLHKYMFFIALF